jgi:hypothetical protein
MVDNVLEPMPTRIPLVFASNLSHSVSALFYFETSSTSTQGASVFGEPNMNTTRIHSISGAQKIVDAMVSHGHKAFDTSRFYGNGTSEEVRRRNFDVHPPINLAL